jgi:hypothetical protein
MEFRKLVNVKTRESSKVFQKTIINTTKTFSKDLIITKNLNFTQLNNLNQIISKRSVTYNILKN